MESACFERWEASHPRYCGFRVDDQSALITRWWRKDRRNNNKLEILSAKVELRHYCLVDNIQYIPTKVLPAGDMAVKAYHDVDLFSSSTSV